MSIYASTPTTGSANRKPGVYLAAGVGYGRIHEPNPILLDIRANWPAGKSWAKLLHHYNWVTFAGGHYVTKNWLRVVDESQIEHARRVLTRLARFEARDES